MVGESRVLEVVGFAMMKGEIIVVRAPLLPVVDWLELERLPKLWDFGTWPGNTVVIKPTG